MPKCKLDLEVCSGTFVNKPCVVDGNLVSGQTYHDHDHYIGIWIKMLIEARNRAGQPQFSGDSSNDPIAQ